jgi:hypothetical protein
MPLLIQEVPATDAPMELLLEDGIQLFDMLRLTLKYPGNVM